MKDWFCIEKIDEQTFAIGEYQHWEETHSYLLCGRDLAVLIDTGLGVGDIKRVVDGLTSLPVRVLTTHAHWDHIGGHKLFGDIAVHEAERDWLAKQFPLSDQEVRAELAKRPCVFPAEFDLGAYRVFCGEPQRLLRDGDVIQLGGRSLVVIHTPGHSPGHCCFYEPERKYLYTGDLAYLGCLYAFYPSTDPILFARSVARLKGYEIKRLLPAHHSLQVPLDLLDRIQAGFDEIEKAGKLQQGQGLFDFGLFQIKI